MLTCTLKGRRRSYSYCMKTVKCVTAGLLGCAIAVLPRIDAQAAQAAAAEKLPSFEVAAIKPSKPDDRSHSWNSSIARVSIENYTLRRLIRVAYGLKSDSQVLGGPKWVDREAFDIEAKIDDAEVAKIRSMSSRERFKETCLMLQSLLADRFRLKVTPGVRDIPVYALEVAKPGAKLTLSTPQLDDSGKPLADRNHSINDSDGHMKAKAISMGGLADWLTGMPENGDRVVVDRTGIKGEYDFALNWTEDRGNGVPPDAAYPGLFTALKEQLGLELKPQKAPVEAVVVESASEPTPN